ncbi:type I-C CRISPR-associated protein Cas8c/Csd1 [soil metagenome]
MILQELYSLSQREHLVPDPDFPLAPVAWLVTVSREGKLLGIVGTHFTNNNERRPKPKAKSFPIPRADGRTSGDLAQFFCDKSEYAFGMAPELPAAPVRDATKLARRATLFRDRIRQCADETGDDGAVAVATLLEDLASGSQSLALPIDCASNDLFAFVFQPDIDLLVHMRPLVAQYWRAVRTDANDVSESRFNCVVTGEPAGTPGTFPRVKNVPGAQGGGVPLVSFNSGAFLSYGLVSNENAPISRAAGEACATALDRLLHPAFPNPDPAHFGEVLSRRSFRISEDTVVCFWSDDVTSGGFSDCFSALFDTPDPTVVGDAYRSLWRGKAPTIAAPDRFFALTLTGAQGRVIVRDWLVTSVSDLLTNLASHFADIDVVRNTPAPKASVHPPALPLGVLLGSLAAFGKRSDIPTALSVAFVNAALRGTPYPLAILQRALERTRAEVGKSEWKDLERRDARVALIKAVLNRRRSLTSPATYPHLTPTMDPTNNAPGYLLGRLMAVIERLQQVAMGDVNASVTDRYFASASASPRAVFTRLLKNARHHARKGKDDEKTSGTARWLDTQLDEIASRFDPTNNGFPAYLDLEQQGLFVLGYHQQRHWLWLSKDERQALATAS